MVSTVDQSISFAGDSTGETIEIREGGIRLMSSRHEEILFEGPAGTGKTFFLVWWALQLCEWFPGVRIYFVRQTRKSLNNSAMSLFEDLLGEGHPVLTPRRRRENRDEYEFPYAENAVDMGDGRGLINYKGRSIIYLVGMDNPDRLMSTEGDVAFFFEATEGRLDGWDKLGSRLRRMYMPWNFRVADCNPAEATHWLNKRANEKLEIDDDVRIQLGDRYTETNKMQRIRTTLKMNPKYWDLYRNAWTEAGLAYKVKLAGLSPVNRERLDRGLWVSAAGQVYGNYRGDDHVVSGSLELVGREWWLKPVENKQLGILPHFKARKVAWFGISVDWGFDPDPGVVQLWAFDEAQRAFLVREWYEMRVPRETWAKRIAAWQKLYDARSIICDHDQDQLRLINEMIGNKLWGGKPIAQNAEKAIKPGIDVTRWALSFDDGQPDDEGNPTCAPEPRIRFFEGALEREDTLLREDLRATSTLEEVGSYIYPPRVDGKTYETDKPDPKCDDHGMDAMRYMMMYAWHHKHRAREEKTGYLPGTLGDRHNHAARFAAAARKNRGR